MLRRRVLFPVPSIGFWLSPEFLGDKEELAKANSTDSCDLTWEEIKAMFMGVENPVAFEVACIAAQACYHNSETNALSERPTFHLSLDGLHCDELYLAAHGEVKRMHNVNTLYLQVYYCEQDSSINDTVAFDCPPGVTKEDLLRAVSEAQEKIPIKADTSRLDRMDDVLTCAALKLHATWEYLPIVICLEVE